MSETRERTTLGRAGLLCLLVASAAVVAGCPTYKDTYSGTFRETDVDTLSASQSVEVDFFRYGDNASAILRYFEPNPVTDEPFGEETFCTWTRGERFDTADRSFQLPISPNAPRVPNTLLRGSFSSKEELTVSLHDADDGEVVRDPSTDEPILDGATMKRVADSPDTGCDSIRPFPIRPNFTLGGGEANTLPKGSGHEIERPVFTMRWVGVQTSQTGEQVPLRSNAQTTDLDTQFEKGRNALRGQLSIKLRPPPDKVRIEGRETSYAIGHPIVVDDRDSGGRAPIVASALQPGRRPGAPSDADGSGKALLFVEDDLRDLDGFVLRAAFGGSFEKIRAGEFPDAHFYVVDVDVSFRTGEIIDMQLPPDRTAWVDDRRIPMKVTDRYLEDSRARLPRFWPPR